MRRQSKITGLPLRFWGKCRLKQAPYLKKRLCTADISYAYYFDMRAKGFAHGHLK